MVQSLVAAAKKAVSVTVAVVKAVVAWVVLDFTRLEALWGRLVTAVKKA